MLLGLLAGCRDIDPGEPLGTLAYRRDGEIWIAGNETPKHPITVSPEHGDASASSPIWSRDGASLFFLRGGGEVYAASGTATNAILNVACGLTESVRLESLGALLAVQATGLEPGGSNGASFGCTWLIDGQTTEVFESGAAKSASDDGVHVISCSRPIDNSPLYRVTLRNIRSGETLWEETDAADCPVLSHDGQWLASSDDGALTLQDAMRTSPPARFDDTRTGDVRWGPRDTNLLLADEGWTVVRADDPTVVLVTTDGSRPVRREDPRWASDGSRVLVQLACEDADPEQHRYRILDIEAGNGDVWTSRCAAWSSASLSATGDRVALGIWEDGQSRVWLAGPDSEETILDIGSDPVWRPLPVAP